VDGKSVQGWTINQAVSKIRGPKGKPVALTLFRVSEELTITLKREAINVPFVELRFEKGVAVIELTRFGENTNRLWDQSVDSIVRNIQLGTVKGIVLDMRGNPGGFLDGAVYVASEFLPRGSVVVKQEFADNSHDDFTVEREGKLLKIPVVVLVNQGSASASEIVAGALQDYKRAQIVGERSFGKGSVQQAIDLSEGAGVHVTVSKWILPLGKWINEKGIEPDVVITNTIKEGNTPGRTDDLQLDKAIELLLK